MRNFECCQQRCRKIGASNRKVDENKNNCRCKKPVRLTYFPIKAILLISPGVDDLKKELKQLGATYVLTEEELRSPETRQWMATDMKANIALALNSVGGKSALDIARCLR